MQYKIFFWAGFGVLSVITFGLTLLGLMDPLAFTIYHWAGLFLSGTLLAIMAPFSLPSKAFQIVTWIIFAIGMVSNFFWFFISTFSVVFYNTINILSIMFIYALFFRLMPIYATKHQGKYEKSAVRGYHIHENAFGIILIVLGFICVFTGWWWWQINHWGLNFLKEHLLQFFGLFCMILGGFLIGRDYRDFLKSKFIEKLKNHELNPDFNNREKFYRISPFGIVFILFGLFFLSYNWILSNLFAFDKYLSIIIGFILIICGSILGGLNPTYFAKRGTNL